MSATLYHRDCQFEDQSIYVTGHTYAFCSFRRCTLILRELPTAAAFESCHFDSCIWQLSLNVRDGQAWQQFLDQIAPVIMDTLPAE